MGVRKSSEQKIAELSVKYPDLDFSASTYIGCRLPITAVCKLHGEITKTGAHWNVNGCPKCGYIKCAQPNEARVAGFKRSAAAKLERGRAIWAAWLSANPNIESNPADYTGMDNTTPVRCVKHDHAYEARPGNFIKQDSGCKFCGLEVISKATSSTPALRLKKVQEVHGGKYTYPNPILSSNGHIEIICPQHGLFVQDYHNHVTGSGCQKCSHRVSKGEMQVAEWLSAQGIEFEIQNRKLLAPAELDIWLPKYNTAIEFNGAHWHAVDRDRKNTARSKFEACQAIGVRLISIFDFEWARSEFAIKALLLAMASTQQSVGAREVNIRPIEASEARALLEKWHVAKFVGGELHLGLFHDTALIGAATFGKSRFTYNRFELLRYATTCHVPGGLAKVVKAAQTVLGFEELVSYCDMRYGTGASYKAAGFVFDGLTAPDYWWFKKNLVKSRYQTQKHKLATDPEFSQFFDADLRETDICEAAGWRQIYGIGHSKWLWCK